MVFVFGWVTVVLSTHGWVATASLIALCFLLHLVQTLCESPLSFWFGWVSVSERLKMRVGENRSVKDFTLQRSLFYH